jgi:recombination protein RecT
MADLKQEIARRQEAQSAPAGQSTAGALLARMAPEFGKVLTSIPPDTFLRLALTEMRNNPALAACTTESLMGALMTAARLSLEPGGPLGQFYLTPRTVRINDVPTKVVVPIIGYRGLRDLALRSGRVASIQAFLIREGDEFRFGSNEQRGFWHEWNPLDTDEDESDRPWVGVLTVAQLTGAGKPVWRYLSRKAVMARKASGAAGNRGPWKDHEEAMVRKTGVRAIANDLPSSGVLAEATRADEQVQVWRAGQEQPKTITGPVAQQHQPDADAPAGVDTTTGEVLEPAPTNATASKEPTQAQQTRRGKREQYAPAPPGSPPMTDPEQDTIPIEDPPA